MKKIETRALVEAAILVGIAAIIMIASAYVPFFILVGVIIWPIPITLLTFKHSVKLSVISLVALLAIVAAFIDPITSVSMVLLYGIPAIVLGFCLRKKYSPFITIAAMTVAMFIAYIVTIKLSSLVFGIDIMGDSFKILDESMARSKELMLKWGISEQQINQSASQAIDSNTIRILLPGLLGVASLMGAYINYYFVGIIFRKLRIKINELKPIEEWYIGKNLSYGLFFVTIVTGLLAYFKVSNADVVFNSVFVIFSFIFQISGFAVVAWFLKGKGISKKVIILLIFVIIFMQLSNFVFYLGLIDYIMDFRKINPSRGKRIPPGE